MTGTCTSSKLDAAFRRGLALSSKIDVQSAACAMSQWDSVAHLQLIIAIEEAFAVRLAPGDVIDLESYADAVAILTRLGRWHVD